MRVPSRLVLLSQRGNDLMLLNIDASHRISASPLLDQHVLMNPETGSTVTRLRGAKSKGLVLGQGTGSRVIGAIVVLLSAELYFVCSGRVVY